MQTAEQKQNVEAVKGTRVRFLDCWTRQSRTGRIIGYDAPGCWKIEPNTGPVTYADDADVTTMDGRPVSELV